MLIRYYKKYSSRQGCILPSARMKETIKNMCIVNIFYYEKYQNFISFISISLKDVSIVQSFAILASYRNIPESLLVNFTQKNQQMFLHDVAF